MASNVTPNVSISKLGNASQTCSPQTSQGGPSNTSAGSYLRAGGSGSYGAGQNTRSGGAPRNKQTSKAQHKASKKVRLADEDGLTESAVMRSINGRKGQTSITHLMNFSLPPRPAPTSHRDSHRHGRRNPTWGMGSGYHAVDKARYVHANYRFIVDPSGDYHAQSVDADEYLEWGSVLQILASPQSQSASCPICLGDPIAPRMAKCGHIFCLHCLIRYMHSSEDAENATEKRARWKSCPLCWDSIYISDARPVRWYSGQEGETPREDGDIVLRLVMRPAGSTLALPKEVSQSMSHDDEIPWHFAADVMDYARVMKGTEDYMLKCFDNELEQIQQLERHDELMFGEDTEWTGRAMRTIREAKEKTKGIGKPPLAVHKPDDSKSKRRPADSALAAPLPASNTPGPTPRTTDQTASTLSTSLADLKQSQGRQTSSTPSDYYFYQALLHYYLSPLDIRILRTAFGEFSLFPSTILPRIERISTGHVVDDELRRRAKYLAHLPHGCEVNFLECDWTDTVDAATLASFAPDIERRRKRNLDKESREEKERVRAEERERLERYAQARSSTTSASGNGKWPASPSLDIFRPSDFAPLGASPGSRPSESLDFAASASPPWQGRRLQNGSSFASLASPSTSPSQHRVNTVWGTSAIAPLSPSLGASDAQQAPVDDGWLQGWEKELMDDRELIQQVAQTSLLDGDDVGQSSSAGALGLDSGGTNYKPADRAAQGAGKGKRKGKKITLMSTTARRGA